MKTDLEDEKKKSMKLLKERDAAMDKQRSLQAEIVQNKATRSMEIEAAAMQVRVKALQHIILQHQGASTYSSSGGSGSTNTPNTPGSSASGSAASMLSPFFF